VPRGQRSLICFLGRQRFAAKLYLGLVCRQIAKKG